MYGRTRARTQAHRGSLQGQVVLGTHRWRRANVLIAFEGVNIDAPRLQLADCQSRHLDARTLMFGDPRSGLAAGPSPSVAQLRSDENTRVNPSGSFTRKTRAPHASAGSDARTTPASLIRLANSSMFCEVVNCTEKPSP